MGRKKISLDHVSVKDVEEYLTDCKNLQKFPNIAGFARHLNVSKNLLYVKLRESPELTEVVEMLKTAIEDTAWNTPGAMGIFCLKTVFRYREKDSAEEVQQNTQPIVIKFESVPNSDISKYLNINVEDKTNE